MLDTIPIQPGVTYDSIIPLIDGKIPMDGVVEYRSSHVDGAKSERIVAGTHFSQQDPQLPRSSTGFSRSIWRHPRRRPVRRKDHDLPLDCANCRCQHSTSPLHATGQIAASSAISSAARGERDDGRRASRRASSGASTTGISLAAADRRSRVPATPWLPCGS